MAGWRLSVRLSGKVKKFKFIESSFFHEKILVSRKFRKFLINFSFALMKLMNYSWTSQTMFF